MRKFATTGNQGAATSIICDKEVRAVASRHASRFWPWGGGDGCFCLLAGWDDGSRREFQRFSERQFATVYLEGEVSALVLLFRQTPRFVVVLQIRWSQAAWELWRFSRVRGSGASKRVQGSRIGWLAGCTPYRQQHHSTGIAGCLRYLLQAIQQKLVRVILSFSTTERCGLNT